MLATELFELALEQAARAILVLMEDEESVLLFDLIFKPSLVISAASESKSWLLALLRDVVIDLVSGATLMASMMALR